MEVTTNAAVVFCMVWMVLNSRYCSSEILGCGGFVKSSYKLDFDKIEIKLFTKQGSLKLKTECAPTTGYYFIPLENKGDYVLKISPPEGWTFEPSEYSIIFDGESDKCSKGEDMDFLFKGFSVFGKVLTSGFQDGPNNVTLVLTGPDNLTLKSATASGGSFHFDSVPPGSYVLKAAHDSLKFEQDRVSFVIGNKNVQINDQIVVSGYDLTGKILSEGIPVQKVSVLLLSSDPVKIPKGCDNKKSTDITPRPEDGKVICVESSKEKGVFRFSGLSPGRYTLIPVYKGENIQYSISPEYQSVELGHESMMLSKDFEVEGFTVQGKVKGHTGAKIVVNGEIRATSGHDGTFTISKMKPGEYEFEVQAEKFLFEKQLVKITPTNPILPEFKPSKFLVCGSIAYSFKAAPPQITLVFNKGGNQKETIRERLTDLGNPCLYVPEGTYTLTVESVPEKYFIPESQTLKVPSSVEFSFKEFSGRISGQLQCKFSPCTDIKVKAENKDTGVVVQRNSVAKDGSFIFEDLESGDYRISVDDTQFCWKESTLENIRLKNSNLDGIKFEQIGVPLEVKSSHSTEIEIQGNTNNQLLQLEAGVIQKICLTDPNSPAKSYRIVPKGCHVFEKPAYSLQLGELLDLKAIQHKHSWNIISPSKIPDLKLTRNGKSYDMSDLTRTEYSNVYVSETKEGDSFNYEVSSFESPGESSAWQIFSYGFIFEPSSFNIDSLLDCQFNLVQVIAKQSHVIKGVLDPPLEGVDVKIELMGDPDATIYVTTNSNGEYIAGPFVHPSGFQVTPEKEGYSFKPFDKDPYSFKVHQLAKIHVKIVGSDESSVSSVLLSLSGPNSYRQNRMANDNGEMTFNNLQPGQYYLKALLKEFSFNPSALNIELGDQETKSFTLAAIRESFSLHGQLSSLSGELVPNLLVSAKGLGNCSEYGEEGTSDDLGNFRIWALKAYCSYQIEVIKSGEFSSKVERTIPKSLEVKIGSEDVHNVSFVVITPVRRMDVSLHCHTNNEKSLEHLKAIVYSSKNHDTPLHVTAFNGISYVVLPPIPKDDSDYKILFESSLNRYQYDYKLPADITFNANSAYAHFDFNFDIEPAPIDQEIGKNSYIAFALIVSVVLIIANYEKVSMWLKEVLENYASSGSSGAAGKKSKSKSKLN